MTIAIIVLLILSVSLTVLNLVRVIDDYSINRLILFVNSLVTTVMFLVLLNTRFRPRRRSDDARSGHNRRRLRRHRLRRRVY